MVGLAACAPRGRCSLLRALSSQRGEVVNDKTRVARCQIPLLTNTSKVLCRQVGVNSGSGWRTLPSPPLGLIISKKGLPFPPSRQRKVSPFLQPSEQNSFQFPSSLSSTDQWCAIILATGKTPFKSPIYVLSAIGHFKNCLVWFRR